MRRSLFCLAALAALACPSFPAAAQPAAHPRYEAPLPIERYALVVGVQNYLQHDPVPNALNDAQTVANALDATRKFTHIRVLPDPESNLDILVAIDEIVQRTGDGAATIVFYFAGHGFQFDGANYLVPRLAGRPVRNERTREMDKQPLVAASVNIATITQKLRARPAGANILFIDACRTHILGVNAFDGQAEPKGFFRLVNPQGALISFSTDFGNVAESHSRRTPYNSPYAAMLSQYVRSEAVRLNPELLSQLQYAVLNATGHQKPEPLNPLAAGTFFYFQPTQTERDAELAMWRKALARRSRSCLDNFLHHYRDGQLARQVSVYLSENPLPAATSEEPECNLLF